MTDSTTLKGFPHDLFLDIMRDVQKLFSGASKRRKLLASLNMTLENGQQQSGDQHNVESATSEIVGLQVQEDLIEQASNARFCKVLLKELAKPGQMDQAMSLARILSKELGSNRSQDISKLMSTLQELYLDHRKQSLQEGDAPDLETYQEWVGFKPIHFYSLTDRFMGREQELQDLDEWIVNDNSTSVNCLCALGGSGKSALAWHWANHSLAYIRQYDFRGIFWCSFYEKDFDFEDFLRAALVFVSGLSEKDVSGFARSDVERKLLQILKQESFVLVLDGLERLMNGYSVVFDRVIDPDTIKDAKHERELTSNDRRLTDPRNGAWLRTLAQSLQSKMLITTRLDPADLEDLETDQPLSHINFMHLKGLSTSDVTEIWKSISPKIPFSDEIKYILTLCENHALITSILARSVRDVGSWSNWLEQPSHSDFTANLPKQEVEIRSYVIGICMRDLDEAAFDILGVLTTSGKPMLEKTLENILLRGSAASGDNRWQDRRKVQEKLQKLVRLGFIGKAKPEEELEYDVHPVIRGTVWNHITDPGRQRFLSHAFSEFSATPGRQRPDDEFELNKAATLFQLLIRSGEIDRAWEMLYNKLWWPLAVKNDNRTLFNLFELLLQNNDPLSLIPLRSRREQANALDILGHLMMSAGDGPRSNYLLQWCGAIRLQSQDFLQYLNARHSRIWQVMYEGRLFETEIMLRSMKIDCMLFGAISIIPNIDCWIGIVLALRGKQTEALAQFDNARSDIDSFRWWAQGLAEGYIYLEEPDKALEWIKKARESTEDNRIQIAWEDLTSGIALFQKGNYDQALDDLSKALEVAVRANYTIIRCFALPYISQIFLERNELELAEQNLSEYFRKDPDNSYQLSASEAWRVKALCYLKRDNLEKAKECAEQAYRLAACDGPPFVYEKGLERAIDTLRKCDFYVPFAHSRLDPRWREMLDEVDDSTVSGRIKVVRLTQENGHKYENSEQDKASARWFLEGALANRKWWRRIFQNAPSEIEMFFQQLLKQLDISLDDFHQAHQESDYKSFDVVYNQLIANRIIYPDKPQKVGDLKQDAKKTWLENREEHEQSLKVFLKTRFAQLIAKPFAVHEFDKVGINAFLDDDKRRIKYDQSEFPATWWGQMEERCNPLHMLILAECMLYLGLDLERFVDNIAAGSLKGIEYSFAVSRVHRAISRLQVTAVSKTEGWDDLQIFLRLEDVKQLIGWQNTKEEAKEFWINLETNGKSKLNKVLQLAEELALRKSSVADYYQSYLHSNTDNIQANMAHLDFTRLRSADWEVTGPWPYHVDRSGYVDPSESISFTDTQDWEEENIRNRLELIKERLGWKDIEEKEATWWSHLEKSYPLNTILRIAEELDMRKSTISAFYLAHVDGESNNLPAVMAFLDFKTFKQREENVAISKARTLNTEGNTLFEQEDYRGAIKKYQAAIELRNDYEYYYTNMASAWEHVTDTDYSEALGNAIAILEQGLQYLPDKEDIKNNLRRVKNKKHLYDKGGSPDTKSNTMLPVVTPIALEYAANLDPILKSMESKGKILKLEDMRASIKKKMGVSLPGVRMRLNETDLPDGTYIFMLDEIPIVSGNLIPDQVMVKVDEATLKASDIHYDLATDPLDGTECYWILNTEASKLGVSNWKAADYLVRHLESLLLKNLNLYFGHQEVYDLLENAWSNAARKILTDYDHFNRFLRILKALLDEGVAIVEFDALCELYLTNAKDSINFDELLEQIRDHPEIENQLPGNGSQVVRLRIGKSIEKLLRDGLQDFGDEHLLSLTPEDTQDLLTAIRNNVTTMPGVKQVLVTDDHLIRRYARKVVELEFPQLYVIGSWELNDAIKDSIKLTIELNQ